MSQFVSRLLVTIVALPIVLGIAWLGGWWLFGLALLAALIGLHELYGMARVLRPLVLAGYAGAIAALLGAQLGDVAWMLGGFTLTLLLAFLLYGIAETRQKGTITIGTTVLGVAWIGLGLGHILLLRDLPEHGDLVVITVLLAVFVGDTAAYLVGRLVGRHKLAPSLSPGKTWEGFLAGAAGAIAVAFFAFYDEGIRAFEKALKLQPDLHDARVGLGWAYFAQDRLLMAREMFESALKRDLLVKDSGRLLGGHGGMLDRIDALLFAGIAAFYVILAFGLS